MAIGDRIGLPDDVSVGYVIGVYVRIALRLFKFSKILIIS